MDTDGTDQQASPPATVDETNYGVLGHPRPWLDFFHTPLSPDRLGPLYPGACFQGEQRSGIHSYDVIVRIQHVDLEAATLSGYLHIHGLTTDYPELTTFFEAEIIGSRYSFLTRKWGASEEIDKRHWTKFSAFEPYKQKFNRDDFQYDFASQDHLFMRWKEHFLVPDHRVQSINGASFAGFYYICCHLSAGSITGFYFHSNSEWFQSISLHHRASQSSASYQLR
ncbi:vacuolar import and degradation protein-domain-containing protein [Syncephalis pseudoplumigaleata]|uniref:Vacuolar import and degradation protein-domain-containing protein n=1 Tax=Syncephalis pseudoplumigaleata TaxID=1712513 RepID=A0A4P9YZJ9_9FUNG|nr:vacuolar import and degradation protein-domain-containing protein [Syncephalis pseudoplumigaleata]|eukprot:RKP24841.1 vacuolar import and degradation protein-domain-containing protein [Syncephalis pseudoplumigaleata]